MNASTVRDQLAELGGYLGVNEPDPDSIGPLLVQISKIGPTPLVALYFDLSYGKKPQSMLVIDSSLESAPVLQNSVRWTGPKSAPFQIRYDVPPQLDKLLEFFLPTNLALEQKFGERDNITRFIRELNNLRRESFRKEFADSYVLYNVSSLTFTYPFVSIRGRKGRKYFQKSTKSFFILVNMGATGNATKLVRTDFGAQRQLFEWLATISQSAFNEGGAQCYSVAVCLGHSARRDTKFRHLYEGYNVGHAGGQFSLFCGPVC